MRGSATLPLTEQQAAYLRRVTEDHANGWHGMCRICKVRDCRFYVDALLDRAIAGEPLTLPRFSQVHPITGLKAEQ